MWKYSQSDGKLFDADGKLVGNGYSGHGAGRNNGAMQASIGTGPIPVGVWRMTAMREDGGHTGPFTIVLEPEPGTETYGRSAFRVHGNNATNDASNGCIIMPRGVRLAMWDSDDHLIEVVP